MTRSIYIARSEPGPVKIGVATNPKAPVFQPANRLQCPAVVGICRRML
jgi:hypothetical protein